MNDPTSQPERDPITHRFIGHAMKVHSLIGPGLNEEIYHQELVALLRFERLGRSHPSADARQPHQTNDHQQRRARFWDGVAAAGRGRNRHARIADAVGIADE